MANPNKFTAKEVLNKVLLDSSGNAVTANSVTSQEALNSVLDTTNNRLNMSLAGGTISGDVTISGDLTVNGSATNTYDELIEGQLIVRSASAGSVTAHADADDLVVENSAGGGMSILTPDGSFGALFFGSPSDNIGAQVSYRQSAAEMLIGTRLSGGVLKLRTADGTLALTIDSSQNVHIGHTSSMNSGGSTPKLQVSDNDNDASIGVYNYGSSSAHSASLRLAHSKNGTIGSHTVLADNDKIGTIEFNGSDGTNFDTIGARIVAEVDGTPAASRMPTALTFSTAAGGADDDITERMRIKADGSITVSASATSGTQFTHGSSSFLVTPDGHNSIVRLDKSATNRGARFEYSTVNSKKWYSGLSDSDHFGCGGDEYFISEDFTTPRFIIEPGGNIGFGTLPTVALDISGSTNVSSRIRTTKSGTGKILQMGADRDTSSAPYIGSESDHAFDIITNNTNRMRIDASGNLGVGVTSIEQKFEVHGGGIRINGNISAPSSGVTGTLIDYYQSEARFWSRGADATTVGGFKFIGLENDGGNQSTQLLINSSGNVAIGSDSPIDGGGSKTVLTISDSTQSLLVFEDTGYESSGDGLGMFAYNDGTLTYRTASRSGTDFSGSTNRLVIDANSRISLGNNDSGGDTSNTIFGRLAGNAISSGGIRNVLIGEESGSLLTTGEQNVAIGRYALKQATTQADDNIAIGNSSMGGNFGTNAVTSCIMIGSSSGNGVLTSASSGSIGIGVSALNALTSGAGSVALGFEALKTNTTGSYNVGIGYQALKDSLDGDSNVAVGAFALENNTSGVGNVAIGSWDSSTFQAPMTTNQVGSFNIAIGSGALRLANDDSVDGSIGIGYGALNEQVGNSSNARFANTAIAIGYKALQQMTSGSGNLAIGYSSGLNVTTGADNLGIGEKTLGGNSSTAITGDANTAVGWSAGSNLEGAVANNTLIGKNAGFAMTTGSGNVAVGKSALDSVTTSSNNTAVGLNALHACGDSYNNVAIGKDAGDTITNTGGLNTVIGTSADVSTGAAENQIVIGNGATGQSNNSVTLGNSSVTSIFAPTKTAIQSYGTVSVTDGSTITLAGNNLGAAILCIYEGSAGIAGVYALAYQFAAVELAGNANTSTSDTAGKVCVINGTNNHTVTIKNNTGVMRNFRIMVYSAAFD